MPPEEWIEIPVPSLVDPTVFELARTQLEENRRRKRRQKTGASWLLQGLTVCRRCGYAYYGKAAPRSRKYDPTNILRYIIAALAPMATGSAARRCATTDPCAATNWSKSFGTR